MADSVAREPRSTDAKDRVSPSDRVSFKRQANNGSDAEAVQGILEGAISARMIDPILNQAVDKALHGRTQKMVDAALDKALAKITEPQLQDMFEKSLRKLMKDKDGENGCGNM
ncbi:unnamed protein product [Penicillium pancosmium]